MAPLSTRSFPAARHFRTSISVLEKLRTSLTGAAILIGLDAVVSGSLVFSMLICPIWFLVAILKALVQRKDLRASLARIAIPLVTLAIVVGNAVLQSRIARDNAERIIEACTRYKAANGAYPNNLDQLVPAYLPAVPSAKYALMFNRFSYWEDRGNHSLMWVVIPPFARSYYGFEGGRWTFRD
jgi:hypothetical protein